MDHPKLSNIPLTWCKWQMTHSLTSAKITECALRTNALHCLTEFVEEMVEKKNAWSNEHVWYAHFFLHAHIENGSFSFLSSNRKSTIAYKFPLSLIENINYLEVFINANEWRDEHTVVSYSFYSASNSILDTIAFSCAWVQFGFVLIALNFLRFLNFWCQ